MKRKSNAQQRQRARVPSDTQLAALQQSTAARKQATVARLRMAISALKSQRREISVQTVYEECGLRYAAIYRNSEALALFRANSTHMIEQKKRTKRKHLANDQTAPSVRDSLLNYKKPQLAQRLRTAQQQLLELQQQLAVSVDSGVKREARIAELEARLAELEPYRTFVEHMRAQMRREEQGRFGDLPPSL